MANSFEGKKHAYRQTQDGIVVSFTVHPNDLDAEFAVAPLGTRYMVAFAEIGPDEKPVEIRKVVVAPNEPPKKERRPFDTLLLSQQAGIRAGDLRFQLFASLRAGFITYTDVADFIRQYCHVASRAELDKPENKEARTHWLILEEEFQGFLTDRMYSGQIK